MPPRPGAFAELVRAPEENLVEISEEMPAVQAALAEPVAVSYHAVHHGARLLGRPLRPRAASCSAAAPSAWRRRWSCAKPVPARSG